MRSTMRLSTMWLMLTTTLLGMGSAESRASSALFMKGDAYFSLDLTPKKLSALTQEPGWHTLRYDLILEAYVGCGTVGFANLRLPLSKPMQRGITMAYRSLMAIKALESWGLPANAPRGLVALVVDEHYDFRRFGVGRRYNGTRGHNRPTSLRPPQLPVRGYPRAARQFKGCSLKRPGKLAGHPKNRLPEAVKTPLQLSNGFALLLVRHVGRCGWATGKFQKGCAIYRIGPQRTAGFRFDGSRWQPLTH